MAPVSSWKLNRSRSICALDLSIYQTFARRSTKEIDRSIASNEKPCISIFVIKIIIIIPAPVNKLVKATIGFLIG